MSDISLEVLEDPENILLTVEEEQEIFAVEINIGEKGDPGIAGVPAGGLTGQILTKLTDNDGDADWVDPPIVTGNANYLPYFDSNGELASSNYQVDSTFGSIYLIRSLDVEDDGYKTFSYNRLEFNPTENSPSATYGCEHWDYSFDPQSTGFEFGTGGESLVHRSVGFNHNGSGDIGGISGQKYNLEIGNRTDAIDFRGFGASFVFGSIHDEVTLTGPIQGYIFQLSFEPDVTVAPTNVYANIFSDNCNIDCDWGASWNSFNAGPQFEVFETNFNYQAFSVNTQIQDLQGNAGLFCFNANPFIGAAGPQANLFGLNFNPQSNTKAGSAYGIWVSMDNVETYAGEKASVTIQDLTFERIPPGQDGNAFTIEFVDDGTAGAETVSAVGNAITFHIDSGVSTATQIKAAADGNIQFVGAFTTTISGNAGDAQVAVGPQALSGGEWSGQKKAAYLDGDVEITGSLTFGGSLSIGQLNAYYQTEYADGSGSPASIHSMISSVTIDANESVTGADLIGLNTACLIQIGANADVASNFLGTSALALPAVVSMGAGSNIDRVAGATFAISLDGGAGGGTIENLDLCRSLAIPNGVTAIDRLKGFAFDLPFGDPGTVTWGFYESPGKHNFFAGDLKIGSGGDIADSGFKLHVDGGGFLLEDTTTLISASGSEIGFFGAIPVAQQSSSGAATAGGAYTATEQAMIQEAYNALRAYGLLT